MLFDIFDNKIKFMFDLMFDIYVSKGVYFRCCNWSQSFLSLIVCRSLKSPVMRQVSINIKTKII